MLSPLRATCSLSRILRPQPRDPPFREFVSVYRAKEWDCTPFELAATADRGVRFSRDCPANAHKLMTVENMLLLGFLSTGTLSSSTFLASFLAFTVRSFFLHSAAIYPGLVSEAQEYFYNIFVAFYAVILKNI